MIFPFHNLVNMSHEVIHIMDCVDLLHGGQVCHVSNISRHPYISWNYLGHSKMMSYLIVTDAIDFCQLI